MSDTRSTRRMSRKLRLAAAIVGVAIALPGLAVAGFSNCTPGVNCPIFDPSMTAGPQASGQSSPAASTIDAPSSLTYRFNTADFTMPVMDAEYYAPDGWQFNFASIRAAQIGDATEGTVGGPVDTTDHVKACDQIFSGDHSDGGTAAADGAPAQMSRAENIAGGVGMTLGHGGSPRTASTAWRFGYVDRVGTNGEVDRQRPALGFLDYLNGKARLCLYLYTQNDSLTEVHREKIIPVTVEQLPAAEPFGWKIRFDTTKIYKEPALRDTPNEVNITDFLFYINDVSAGNWNTVPGQPSGKVTLSKTPTAAGTYEFRGVFSTCRNGFNAATATGCANDDLYKIVRSRLFDITPAPSQVVHNFARLTGPTSGGSFANSRMAVLRNTNKVTVQWAQPALNPSVKVKGYVLTIANPGDQDSRHMERIVTNTTDAVNDPNDTRNPCGATGTDATCSLELTFPLNGLAKTLTGEGKYDIALSTVWQDGYRTDSRDGRALCDDMTAMGSFCGALKPAPKVVAPGVSTWSVFITKTPWPDSLGGPATVPIFVDGGAASYTAPQYLLLLDYSLKKAAFVDLSPRGGKPQVWGPVTSNLIIGDLEMINFDSGRYLGNGENFRFDDDLNPFSTGGTFRVYNAYDCPACQKLPAVTRTVSFSGQPF